MITLRPYQQRLKADIYTAWEQGARNVCAVLPTGGGKTVIFSDVIREHNGAACAIAHRQELVGQISIALARDGVRHRVIGPSAVVRLCSQLHVQEVGRSFVHPGAQVAVAGVDTLPRRKDISAWAGSVTLWVQDECHHVLNDNKWGAAVKMFPNARGLGVTATPMRADGKGLGAHVEGVFHALVQGPGMRQLITDGYLTDYRIFAPLSDMDLSQVGIGASGDYVPAQLRTAARRSHIIGDVVKHYTRYAAGRLGVTFATDVQTATDIAAQFNAAGTPAEVVHAGTPDKERIAILRRFRSRQLMQLVNVDLFGEGFDLPAIEVVSMARPTQSYNLFVQQFGRALRIMDGKERALIIDHVGNVDRHKLPDRPRAWSLDRREKRAGSAASDVIPVTTCPKCVSVYERILPACPYCGYKPEPQRRTGPEWVDGDLTELDEATLARMRGAVAAIDKDVGVYRAEQAIARVPAIGQLRNCKLHAANQHAQGALREAIAWWAGYQRAAGRSDSESYRRFYFKFGMDVLSAQALKRAEAEALTSTIYDNIGAGAH